MKIIVLSDHYKQRFKQRWKGGGTPEKIAIKAYKKGKPYNSLMKRYEILKGEEIFKVYKKMVFVYTKQSNNTLLATTVYHLNKDKETKYLKKPKIYLCE